MLVRAERPVWHRLKTAALTLHAGYGHPVYALVLAPTAAALVIVTAGGGVLDLIRIATRWRNRRRRGPPPPPPPPTGRHVLSGPAMGSR